MAIIQSENDAPVSADVYLDASSENDVRVEQYRSQYGDAADVDLLAADLSTVRVFQEYNFGAAATIAVSNGVSNIASITQKDGNVAVAGSLALDGSSNAMSIHQTGSWDPSASIDVTGDGNDFGSAGGYSISQMAVDNSGLAYGLPSAEIVITGNDNWGGINQYAGSNLSAAIDLANADRNMALVDQTGSDNTSTMLIDSSTDNAVTLSQSGMFGTATTMITGGSNFNTVNVSQM